MVLSAQHLSPELGEKSRASSRRPDPPRCLLWDYWAEGVGVHGGLGRGRLRRQLRERGSHGKGPPKAWNASEVSRGWSGGNQRSSPGMEQVLLYRPSGIKDMMGLKRLVLAL